MMGKAYAFSCGVSKDWEDTAGGGGGGGKSISGNEKPHSKELQDVGERNQGLHYLTARRKVVC